MHENPQLPPQEASKFQQLQAQFGPALGRGALTLGLIAGPAIANQAPDTRAEAVHAEVAAPTTVEASTTETDTTSHISIDVDNDHQRHYETDQEDREDTHREVSQALEAQLGEADWS